jgi:hypothetical protein
MMKTEAGILCDGKKIVADSSSSSCLSSLAACSPASFRSFFLPSFLPQQS